MKRPLSAPGRRLVRGLSLVELMVSIAIGLIIAVAVMSSYLGSASATRLTEAQVRMNEDGQAALTLLAQQIRMAGDNPKQPGYATGTPRNPITPTFIVRGCNGTFSNIGTATQFADLICASGGPNSIAVRYEADLYNTVPTAPAASGGQATDCLGQALPVHTGVVNLVPSTPTNVTFTVADNRFYVGTSNVVVTPGLYCKGNGNATAQRLVENVEDLQFQYGSAPAASTSLFVAGYIGADGVAALGLVDDAANWGRVVTVRICVVIRSESPVAPDAESAQYSRCDGTLNSTPGDLYLRQAYSTTVMLRNRLVP